MWVPKLLKRFWFRKQHQNRRAPQTKLGRVSEREWGYKQEPPVQLNWEHKLLKASVVFQKVWWHLQMVGVKLEWNEASFEYGILIIS